MDTVDRGARVARLWRGWTTLDNADSYQHVVSQDVLPGIAARGLAGYDGAFLLRRELDDEVEFATLMLFDSRQAVAAFAGPDHAAAYVPPQARAVLARFDDRSAHFDVISAPRRA